MAKLTVATLSKSFDELKVLEDVSLSVREGEFVSLVGPSGCGKTTFLRIIAGLEAGDAGEIRIDGDRVTRPGTDRGFVFQSDSLLPWRTVLHNVLIGLEVSRACNAETRARALSLLRLVGLSGFEHFYPRQLSGGMRQRVNLARAFANDPAILLMDEPLGALDEQTKMLVQDDLLKLWEESRKTVIFITHSLDEAVVLGDRVAVMSHRPGRIKAMFDVRLQRPRNALELRNNPDFIEVRRHVWEALREEVLRARGE
jgi:NitT/TauT family transport system ATP-binding protein